MRVYGLFVLCLSDLYILRSEKLEWNRSKYNSFYTIDQVIII